MNFKNIAQGGKVRKQNYKPLVFWSRPRGVLSVVSDISLTPEFALNALNFLINENGLYQIRPGLRKVTTNACDAAIKEIAYLPVAGTYYTLLIDANNKFYKCTGSEPNLDPGSAETTLEGEATTLPFHGHAVLLDGSYIKYFDDTSVKLAYDDGDSGSQHDTTCETFSSTDAKTLRSGGNTRVGAKITTSSWDTGYTIDLTSVIFWLKKTGSPTGSIVVEVYSDDSGPDTLLATSDEVKVSDLTSNFVKHTFDFDTGALSLSHSTTYYVVVKYTGGNSSNYVTVAASSKDSGGDMYYYDGSWNAVSTANALCMVKPGKPPKGKFGDVSATRLFVAGDPDKPGVMHFSNTNSLFDWSTNNAAGYVTAVDDNANSYPVGAIVAHYGDVYVFGKKEQPFLCKLTGSIPANFSLPPLWQKTYTDYRSLLSLPNNIWLMSSAGLNSLAGVKEYGDLRIAPYSNAVQDIFRENWDADSFMGFNPKDDQLLVKLSGYSNVLVCHIGRKGTPFTFYSFEGVTPTAFHTHGGNFYVGGDDGHLYRLDPTLYQDDGSDPSYELKSGNLEQPFGAAFLDNAYINADSNFTQFDVNLYLDGNSSTAYSQTWTNDARPMQRNVHVRGNSLQVKLDSFTVSGRGVIHSMTFMRRRLSRQKKV